MLELEAGDFRRLMCSEQWDSTSSSTGGALCLQRQLLKLKMIDASYEQLSFSLYLW
jgi:hypothetical protein